MQINISCGEKEIAQHQVKMPALCDSVFTYKVLSLLCSAFPDEATDNCVVSDVKEIAGYGIRAQVNGKEVCVEVAESRARFSCSSAIHRYSNI